jgi:hypothetical protein
VTSGSIVICLFDYNIILVVAINIVDYNFITPQERRHTLKLGKYYCYKETKMSTDMENGRGNKRARVKR